MPPSQTASRAWELAVLRFHHPAYKIKSAVVKSPLGMKQVKKLATFNFCQLWLQMHYPDAEKTTWEHMIVRI
jgi:hypothetical protein